MHLIFKKFLFSILLLDLNRKQRGLWTLIIRGLLFFNDFNFFLNNNSGTLFEGFQKSNNFEKLSTLYYKFVYPEWSWNMQSQCLYYKHTHHRLKINREAESSSHINSQKATYSIIFNQYRFKQQSRTRKISTKCMNKSMLQAPSNKV